MLDVFVICDQQLFELSVRGCIDKGDAVERLAEIIELLPETGHAVLDLSAAEAVTFDGAVAVVSVLRAAALRPAQVIVAAGDPAIRSALIDADVASVAPLVETLQRARSVASSLSCLV